jgi:hypothetical protein
MAFHIKALSKTRFQHLFRLPPAELASVGAIRMTASTKPGFPCRVSLRDAEVGEEVILVHHEHQTADTPYKASHAVYVRAEAEEAELKMDEIPEVLRSRILSLRAFDGAGMMIAADLADGDTVETTIQELFQNARAEYIHIHFAKMGCYAARADRA